MNHGRRGFCRGLAGLGCLGLGGCKIEELVDVAAREESLALAFPELPPQIPDRLANADATLRASTEAMLETEIPLLRGGSLRERSPADPRVVLHFVQLMREFGLQPAANRGGWLQAVPLEIIEPTGAEPRVVLRPESEASFLTPEVAPDEASAPTQESPPRGPDADPDGPPDADAPAAPPDEGESDGPPEALDGPPDADTPLDGPPESEPEPPPSRALELAAFGAFRQRSSALPHQALPLSPLIPFETPLAADGIVGRVALVRAPKDLDLSAADAVARVDLLMAAVHGAGAIGCLVVTRDDEEAVAEFREAWRRQVRRAGSAADGLLIEGLLVEDARAPIRAALASDGTWVLDLDLGTRELEVESSNIIGRVSGSERPNEAVVLTCNWDTTSADMAALETPRLLATLAAFHQLAEWSRRSTPPRYSLILLLTVDAGLAAGHTVHASWSADYGAETQALVALTRPSPKPLPAIELSGRYDAAIAELARRVAAADFHDLLLTEELELPSLAPYLRHPAPIVCIGAPSAEALVEYAKQGEGADVGRPNPDEDDRGGDGDGDTDSDGDPNAESEADGLFADVRMLRNLVLSLAAVR